MASSRCRGRLVPVAGTGGDVACAHEHDAGPGWRGSRLLSRQRPQLLHEILIGRSRDEGSELGPVVADQARAAHGEIVDLPLVSGASRQVVHRDLASLLRDDGGPHGGRVPLDRLVEVQEPLAIGDLDAGKVCAPEQLGKEAHELGLLGRGPLLPERAQRALCHLVPVEDLVEESAGLGLSDGSGARAGAGGRDEIVDLRDPDPDVVGGAVRLALGGKAGHRDEDDREDEWERVARCPRLRGSHGAPPSVRFLPMVLRRPRRARSTGPPSRGAASRRPRRGRPRGCACGRDAAGAPRCSRWRP